MYTHSYLHTVIPKHGYRDEVFDWICIITQQIDMCNREASNGWGGSRLKVLTAPWKHRVPHTRKHLIGSLRLGSVWGTPPML